MTIEDIFNEYWPGFMTYREIKKDKSLPTSKNISVDAFMAALKQAYQLGLEKNLGIDRAKENNPYHIDYERQGKLFEDDELTGI